MLNSPVWAETQPVRPQYQKLAQFLIAPLLDNPSEMKIDCEPVNEQKKIWIRIDFDEADKGRVYGRSGRNLQAIRMILDNAAAFAGQSIYLDIYNDRGMDSQNFGTTPGYSGKFVKKTDRRRYRPRGSSPYSTYNNEGSL